MKEIAKEFSIGSDLFSKKKTGPRNYPQILVKCILFRKEIFSANFPVLRLVVRN